jgi:hypothetical protein
MMIRKSTFTEKKAPLDNCLFFQLDASEDAVSRTFQRGGSIFEEQNMTASRYRLDNTNEPLIL